MSYHYIAHTADFALLEMTSALNLILEQGDESGAAPPSQDHRKANVA
jgi:hypothetical protein